MKKGRGAKTAFMIELTALFLILVVVTVTVSAFFVICRSRSIEAMRLSDAVILAQDAAEAASASPTADALSDALASMDVTADSQSKCLADEGKGTAVVWAVASPDTGSGSGYSYIIRLTRCYRSGSLYEGSAEGDYAGDTIDVFDAGTARDADGIDASALKDPLYTLETGSFFREEDGQ